MVVASVVYAQMLSWDACDCDRHWNFAGTLNVLVWENGNSLTLPPFLTKANEQADVETFLKQ